MKVSGNIWLNAICYALSVVCFGVALFYVMGLTLSPANETAANVILKPLKATLTGGLLATTALTTAYGNPPSTFDPSLPVIQIYEQYVAVHIPWLNHDLVLKHSSDIPEISKFDDVLKLIQQSHQFFKTQLGNKNFETWFSNEKSKLNSNRNQLDTGPLSIADRAKMQKMAMVDVNKFINDNIISLTPDQRALGAIYKMAILKEFDLGLEPENMYFTIELKAGADPKKAAPEDIAMNLVVRDARFEEWHLLTGNTDQLVDISTNQYPNTFVFLINATGVYQVSVPRNPTTGLPEKVREGTWDPHKGRIGPNQEWLPPGEPNIVEPRLPDQYLNPTLPDPGAKQQYKPIPRAFSLIFSQVPHTFTQIKSASEGIATELRNMQENPGDFFKAIQPGRVSRDWIETHKAKLGVWIVQEVKKLESIRKEKGLDVAQKMAMVDVNEFANELYRESPHGSGNDAFLSPTHLSALKMSLLRNMNLGAGLNGGWDNPGSMWVTVETIGGINIHNTSNLIVRLNEHKEILGTYGDWYVLPESLPTRDGSGAEYPSDEPINLSQDHGSYPGYFGAVMNGSGVWTINELGGPARQLP